MMGMPNGFGRRKTAADGTTVTGANPDPRNFKVCAAWAGPAATALLVDYPDATNYEGLKILVVEGRLTRDDVAALTVLDPHFSETAMPTVLARFIPTDWGWGQASLLASDYDPNGDHRVG